MSGYYPATYGFENDENDTIPQNWVDNSETYAYVKVINAILLNAMITNQMNKEKEKESGGKD